MKMKIEFKRCLVSLLSLSMLFFSCNCLWVNAAEEENIGGSQNLSVTDLTESSGEENTSNEQYTETTEASTEATQGVTDEAEGDTLITDSIEMNLNSSGISEAALNAPAGSVCYTVCDTDDSINYFNSLGEAILYSRNAGHDQHHHDIFMLVSEYSHKGPGGTGTDIETFWNIQNAKVTIQPDASLGTDAKCTLKRGQALNNMFEIQTLGVLVLNNIVIDGENKDTSGRLIYSFGNVTLNNCELMNANVTSGDGKGAAIRMENANGRELIINDCYIHDNFSQAANAYGVGLSAQNCKVTVTNSRFENNVLRTTTTSGGGAGIYIQGEYTNPTTGQIEPNLFLTNVDVIGNKVEYVNQIPNDLDKRLVGGGGIFVTEHARVKIEDCEINNNTAPVGAGIYLGYGRIDLKDVVVTGNVAEKGAGGVYLSSHADAKRFSVQGLVIIDGNDTTDPKFNTDPGNGYPTNPVEGFSDNVYVQNNSTWGSFTASISVAGNLTEGSSIGITVLDSLDGRTTGRMSPGGQFGKAISSDLPNTTDDTTVVATTYSGLDCFFRDTNGHDPDGLYLYGGPGNANSALYGTNAIIWHEGSAPVNDVDFEFTKTDEQGTAFGLSEATFEVVDSDTSSSFAKITASTDASGKVTFKGLPVGATYYLYEIKTKSHYSLPLGYWSVVIDDAGNITVTAVSQGGYVPEFAVTESGGTKTYSLINHPQFQLPLTGGDGTGKIIVIGIAVLCTPILIKLKSFRKKEKSL